MKGNRGFVNRAKSGARAMPARWRQAAAKGRIEQTLPPHGAVAVRRLAVAAPGSVPLDGALCRLGVASRAEARRLIRCGRVTVDGRGVRDPKAPVLPQRALIAIDGRRVSREP